MKNTGALLKAKRESSSLSLSEVALATKINPKILTAIENGDEKNLPAKTFLKGFVKSYALFLKMDVDEVMRTFQDEMGGPKPQLNNVAENAKNEASAPSRRRVGDENSSGMRTVAVVVIVLLIGLIIGVRELIEKYQRERVVESSVTLKVTPVEQPVKPEEKVSDEVKNPNAATPKDPVETKSAEAKPEEPESEPTAAVEPPKHEAKAEAKTAEVKPIVIPVSVFPNSVELRPVSSKPAEVKPEENKTVEVKAAEPVKPEPAQVAQAAQPAEPAKTADTAATNVGPASALKAAKNEIILEALDKVEVKFEVKGETKKVSLAPTQVHTIRADQSLTLDLSDGGAVNIILNGRERGVPGDLGKPKTIKIP